ncbi:MAG: hypothetical protein P8J17_09550 [Halioglobus sp.]|nr:hypothetical protein [Halioglobus sp.]
MAAEKPNILVLWGDDIGVWNTSVIFSTDNGAEKFTWPDGGSTPYHG